MRKKFLRFTFNAVTKTKNIFTLRRSIAKTHLYTCNIIIITTNRINLKMTNINKLKGAYNVENMRSSNGNEIPNQFIIQTPDALIFQSYHSVIAIRTGGKVYLDREKWDYSKTTGKYRNEFLREKKADTERKIKSGEYILEDLN